MSRRPVRLLYRPGWAKNRGKGRHNFPEPDAAHAACNREVVGGAYVPRKQAVEVIRRFVCVFCLEGIWIIGGFDE